MKLPAPLPLLAAVVLWLSTWCAGAAELTIIDLHHRTADDVIPVLRPLVGSDVALSGSDYKLFVRGDPSEIAALRDALVVLDRAPRQLLVSVRYGANPQRNTGAGGVSVSGSQIVVRGGTTVSTASDSSVSSVRVLEGNGAHIATGQSVPIVTAVIWPSRSNHQAVVGGVATDYRELTSGFTVLPRVNGDRVILDISAQQERATNLGSSSAMTQRAATTLSGRLGEWIDLGGVTSSMSEQITSMSLGGAKNRVATQSDQQTIAVKVEQVD